MAKKYCFLRVSIFRMKVVHLTIYVHFTNKTDSCFSSVLFWFLHAQFSTLLLALPVFSVRFKLWKVCTLWDETLERNKILRDDLERFIRSVCSRASYIIAYIKHCWVHWMSCKVFQGHFSSVFRVQKPQRSKRLKEFWSRAWRTVSCQGNPTWSRRSKRSSWFRAVQRMTRI